jgi:hypothetical protein
MTQSTPDPQDPTAAAGGGDPAGSTPDPAAGSGPPAAAPTEGAPQRSAEKDPSDWATGGEPATGPQLSYLSTLAQEAGVDVPADLNKADASKLIEELQGKTGRGGQPAGG